MTRRRVLAVLVILLLTMTGARAHETRPAWLELKEIGPNRFTVLWRIPVLAGMRLPVRLAFPDGVRDLKEPLVSDLPESRVERRCIDVGPAGLTGRRIEFPGLQLTITDALVRIEMLDGTVRTTIVHPSRPWMEVTRSQSAGEVAGEFLVAGIRHILYGPDHLLFVFGLLMIVSSGATLLKTISAFTVAHSITLTAATMGWACLPLPPLEAAIALSILFLAPEIVRARSGATSLTIRQPWVVAFLFGLLHGFGFATGLATTGVPPGEIPLALLCFNVGVELGQLAFVLAVLGLGMAAARLHPRWTSALSTSTARTVLSAYLVGTLGAFWTIERTVILLGGAR